MVAAYLMVVFAVDLGWPYWLSFLLALAGMALLGAIFISGFITRCVTARFLPVIIAHRRFDPARQFGAGDLRPAAAGAGGMVRDPRHPARAVYLDSQYLLIIAVTIVLDLQLLVLRAHHARQEAAGDLAGQGDGFAARHLRLHHDHDHLHLFGSVGGLAGILVAPVLFVSIQMGSTIALKAFAATIIGGFGDVTGAIIGGLSLGIIETFGAAYISVPTRTPSPSWCWWRSWCSGRRALRRTGRGEA